MHRLSDVLRFEEHRQKHRRRCFFQKHRQNIASLRKKHDVFHDVFPCLKYTIQVLNVNSVIRI